MTPSIGSRVEYQGQTLIVGHQGRLYIAHTFIDAWGRTRHTQKVTKYRIVACGCGHSFIAHDGRMRTCATCKVQVKFERHSRHAAEAQPPATIACVQCSQRVIAQRRTRMYCSRACQQTAYRQRRKESPIPRRPESS